MRRLLAFLFLLIGESLGQAQDFKMEPGPLSPADSLKAIKTRPGFKVELMAAEPTVMDPIAFAWGPDGKFWVVEMGDYPLGAGLKNKPGGRIKILEKTKPDGPYDKATLFMDGLNFPTGVFPYKNGVLVTCAPDIFYAEMGKDGKVKKDVIFTGFKEGNQQHRVNGLTWGIDNWIYGANGDSGGQITGGKKTGLLERKVMEGTVDIRGRDFRFKVESGAFETVSGQSQFGRCRDDWGNWFGNNNSNPMFHFALEDHYLKRNPHVLYPDPKVQVVPGAERVFPISKPLPRFNTPAALNHFTSACSTIIYRDNLFGPAFEGNAFIAEPVHNLIHRRILMAKGVTFTSERAADEQESEFLASSDNWFRPAMIQVGPDGALWIADMYRYVIEHPEWIPKDWQKKLDLRAGHDKGRIYRVMPEGKKPREIVALDKMKIEELVKQLESPNGWVRDTAHRLLLLTGREEATLKILDKMTEQTKMPQARLHALYFRASMFFLGWESLDPVLQDPHPAIRKHAAKFIDEDIQLRVSPAVLDALAKDGSIQVRQQLAYVLLGKDGPADKQDSYVRFARLLRNNVEDPLVLAAGLSSINKYTWSGFLTAILNEEKLPIGLFRPMMQLAKAHGKPSDSTAIFVRQLNAAAEPGKMQLEYVIEMLDMLEKNNQTLTSYLERFETNPKGVLARLNMIHAEAGKTVQNPKASMSERLLAMRLLGQGLGNDRDDHKILLALLTPQTPDDVQAAVIQQLTRVNDPRVPGLVLAPWKSYSPALRNQVLDTMFARPLWTRMTLDAIKRKDVSAAEIDAVRRQKLLLHKDPRIRTLAQEVFAAASSKDRGDLVNQTWLQLPDKVDAARGAKLYAKSCATCHKLGDVGQNVGPDLASVGDRSVQGLLTAILDPNRAVETRYINYVATTKKGLLVSGILTSETSTSITLTANDGKQHQLLRNELEDLTSTGKSMMPEGLEKDLTPQDLADVIEYVRVLVPTAKRKVFPGNEPKTLTPGKDGRIHLLPTNGAIYGSSIVLEKQHGNLGYWSKQDDHVVWTVELAKETTFSVWLDYACADDSAGNTVIVQCGSEKIRAKVGSTRSWDAYQVQSVGALRIPAGRHDIVIRGEVPIRGALLDLKEVKLQPR